MRAKANSAGRNVSDAGVSHPSGESHSPPTVSVNQNLPLVKFFQCQDIVVQRLTMHVDEALPGDVVCFQLRGQRLAPIDGTDLFHTQL